MKTIRVRPSQAVEIKIQSGFLILCFSSFSSAHVGMYQLEPGACPLVSMIHHYHYLVFLAAQHESIAHEALRISSHAHMPLLPVNGRLHRSDLQDVLMRGKIGLVR